MDIQDKGPLNAKAPGQPSALWFAGVSLLLGNLVNKWVLATRGKRQEIFYFLGLPICQPAMKWSHMTQTGWRGPGT